MTSSLASLKVPDVGFCFRTSILRSTLSVRVEHIYGVLLTSERDDGVQAIDRMKNLLERKTRVVIAAPSKSPFKGRADSGRRAGVHFTLDSVKSTFGCFIELNSAKTHGGF